MTVKTSPSSISDYQERIKHQLEAQFSTMDKGPDLLHQAMRYSVLNGGKRIRACLVYASGQCFGATLSALDTAAVAVELIHSYSLIHDDLPAMDNDDLRRGKASCHKAFNEATAILAGDALQSLAFELLSQTTEDYDRKTQLHIINLLASAIGQQGMAGGQMLDMDAENHEVSRRTIETIHSLKTGALIRASTLIGANIAGAKNEEIKKLSRFSETIGLAFQIKDDLLDQESSTSQLGKTAGKDRTQGKACYDNYRGRQRTRELQQSAEEQLSSLLGNTDALKRLADYIIERNN